VLIGRSADLADAAHSNTSQGFAPHEPATSIWLSRVFDVSKWQVFASFFDHGLGTVGRGLKDAPLNRDRRATVGTTIMVDGIVNRRSLKSCRVSIPNRGESTGVSHTVKSHSQWPAQPADGSRDWRPVCLRRDSSRIHIRSGWLVSDFSARPCTHAAECRDQYYRLLG
jgi:hypothetical protein